MSKPTGDSLHPGKGFWGNCPRPTLPAILGALLLIMGLALLSTTSEATANPVPRLIPSAAGTAGGDASPVVLGGLVMTGESSDTGRWIVAGRPGRLTDARAKRFGAAAISKPLGIYALDEESAAELIISLRRVGTYRFSEPDIQTAPRQNIGREDPTERNPNQWWLKDINRPARIPTATRESPTIALLEESLDPDHPDLAELEAGGRLLGASSLGYDRDLRGTAMAALAASPGSDPGGKVTGIWPKAKVRLVPSEGSCAEKTEAVYRAARNRNNRVLTMGYSFMPGQHCYAHYLATEYAVYRGLVPVAAAGNSSGATTGSTPPQPASDPHVLAVTASDQDRGVWTEALGGPWVDLTAPGDTLRVAWLNSGVDQSPWDWSFRSGTEYSATIVSAAAAWVLQERPGLEARQVIRLLTNTATPLLGQTNRDPSSGHGLLNLAKALRDPAPVDDPFEPNDDISWVRANSLLSSGPSDSGKVRRKPFWQSNGRKREVIATLGRTKDPADVYRIRIAPETKILVKVTANGRTNLKGLQPDAKSLADRENVVEELTDRPKGKTYAMELRNPGGQALTAFLAVEVGAKQVSENFSYRLSVKTR